MRAALFDRYGGPEVLRVAEVADPVAGERDVLIRVRAASVNPVDCKIRQGYQRAFIHYRLPQIVGMDVAGDVIAVGSAVTRFKVGDAVISSPTHRRPGTCAELVAIDESAVALKPARLDYHEGAALPLAGLTAWASLVDATHVQPGQKVFIQAGAGGVGTIAIQLAKHLGATVATTCSGRNVDFVQGLGADVVIDYTTTKYEDVLSGYDMVLESIGGDARAKSVKVLRRGGQMSLVVTDIPAAVKKWGTYWGVARALANQAGFIVGARLGKGVRVKMVVRPTDGAMLQRLADVVQSGAVTPVVDAVLGLDEIAEAHRRVDTGRTRGKVVIAVA
ncbi:MAG: zinc-containing alcohol dehydrogenase [Myxococcaceae bacterium]|nr:zinc-containing alcohol dehydrogenase [Myxococcaceae bacterium]